MKPYKISLIRLCLVLLGYLIYNLVYFALFYSAGYAFFILWPIFFLAIGLILLGNFFAFRDPLKLKSTCKDNQSIRKTSNIQVISDYRSLLTIIKCSLPTLVADQLY